MYRVNVDGTPEREPMSQGQIVGICWGSVLSVLAAVFGDVDPHGVASLTAGATIVLISAAGPTTAHRLALAWRDTTDRAYVRRRIAMLNSRLDAMDRQARDHEQATDKRLADLDLYVAQEVRGMRRRVAELDGQSS